MKLTRANKLFINTSSSLFKQMTTIICGFILPRMFLVTYGSALNGLQASITQFLGFVALCELGVGAVVQSALYKPLAQKNELEISKIICSAERFFHKLGYLLLAYTFVLMVFYPLLIKKEFGFLYTSSLILIISLSSLGQYFLGITYRLLLSADQMGFVQISLNTLSIILNTVISVLLMRMEFPIHIVMLVSSVIFILQPVCLVLYVHKHYHIDHHLKLTEEPIKQKWNGIAQHLSTFVFGGTDMMVLTVFSTLQEVSVYVVYNLVVNGMRKMVWMLLTEVQPLFGNMLAHNEKKNLYTSFSQLEVFVHAGVTFLFVVTALLIVPFVRVYTQGVTDVNYIQPVFGYLLTAAFGVYCLRLPYNTLVMAAGHFKETQNSAFIEAGLNIVLSVLLVFRYGLIGVALGSLIAIIYRTTYLAWYLSGHIINRSLTHFAKHIFIDMLVVFITVMLVQPLQLTHISYMSWFVLACKTACVCTAVSLFVNVLAYRTEMLSVYNRISARFIKNKEI